MVWRLGMGSNGFIGDYEVLLGTSMFRGAGSGDRLSDRMKDRLNDETNRILTECVNDVEALLRKENEILDRFANELLKREELEYDDVEAIFAEYGKQRVIPDTKPAFKNLQVDLDGRIWVHVHVEAEPIPEEEREEPSTGSGRGPSSNVMVPAERWREPPVYDVFEPDGRFMGTLRLPVRARLMQARGNQVWAIDRDELGVEYVVRYRLENEAVGPSGTGTQD